ncbi:MAG TPA: penicillin acylase family protein, partial [Ktedonobacterales bacterium]|nr:penicillin acylase family protein [Ktedonobacterales bacterium]
ASGAYEWLGYVEQSQMPTLFNPPTHIIAAANNQIVPANYPIYVTSAWDDQGYRDRRIVDLLTAKPRLSAGDFAQIQADVYAEPSAQIVPELISLGTAAGGDAATAAKLLTGWNGEMTRDSVAATVYEVAVGLILRAAIEPSLGKKLYSTYVSNSSPSILFNVAVNLLNKPIAPFFGSHTEAGAVTSRNTAVAQALAETISQLRSKYGSDSSKWQWGMIHQATFEHPLASVTPLNLIFGVAPVARPGDGVTVNVGGDDNFAADPPTYEQDTVSSMREIIDLQNFDRSVWVTTTGESGEPFSDHYKDLVPVWDQNHYQQMDYTPDAVAKAEAHLLTLQP